MSLDKFKIAMQYAMPKHFISRVVGKLAAAKAGALTTTLIKLFIKQYKVDMNEALYEDPAHYKTFNEFSTGLHCSGRPTTCNISESACLLR